MSEERRVKNAGHAFPSKAMSGKRLMNEEQRTPFGTWPMPKVLTQILNSSLLALHFPPAPQQIRTKAAANPIPEWEIKGGGRGIGSYFFGRIGM